MPKTPPKASSPTSSPAPMKTIERNISIAKPLLEAVKEAVIESTTSKAEQDTDPTPSMELHEITLSPDFDLSKSPPLELKWLPHLTTIDLTSS